MLHGPDPGPCREIGVLFDFGNPLRRSAERGSVILMGYNREGMGMGMGMGNPLWLHLNAGRVEDEGVVFYGVDGLHALFEGVYGHGLYGVVYGLLWLGFVSL